jgi:hypothetical protein
VIADCSYQALYNEEVNRLTKSPFSWTQTWNTRRSNKDSKRKFSDLETHGRMEGLMTELWRDEKANFILLGSFILEQGISLTVTPNYRPAIGFPQIGK